MWWISASDTILQWAVLWTRMINAKVFDIWGDMKISNVYIFYSAPHILGLPKFPPCTSSKHWDVCVLSFSFFINDVHECQLSFPFCLLFLSHWHRGMCDKDSSKSSLLYTYLHWTVCKPLSDLSLFLPTWLIIYFPKVLPSEEHTCLFLCLIHDQNILVFIFVLLFSEVCVTVTGKKNPNDKPTAFQYFLLVFISK